MSDFFFFSPFSMTKLSLKIHLALADKKSLGDDEAPNS